MDLDTEHRREGTEKDREMSSSVSLGKKLCETL
jgi:hypothetical protein